jgi:hypothetical protein
MDKHYILRDKQEIFGIYLTLEHAYISLLQFIYNFFRYSKLISNANASYKLLKNHFQIISYSNNIINNIYYLHSNYYLKDFDSNLIKLESITIQDYLTKIEICTVRDNDEMYVDSNDLNLFIPMQFTETERGMNNRDEINIEEIKLKMEELEKNKRIHIEKLNEEKTKIKQKEEQLVIDKMKTERLKQFINTKKEKIDKLKNKFKIDKNIYFQIKNEILESIRTVDNLPELFINEYHLFKKLDDENILECNDSEYMFNEYIKEKDELEKNSIHHINNKYDELFNNNINWSCNNFFDNDNDNDNEND